MSFSRARASRLASSCPKDFDFQFFVYQDEGTYMMFYGKRRLLNWLKELPEQGGWNAMIALLWLTCVVILLADIETDPIIFHVTYTNLIDFIFNVCYGIHLIAMIYYDTLRILHEETKLKGIRIIGYVIDVMTYFYYLVDDETYFGYQTKLYCYFFRIHRPVKFLYDLMYTYLGATPMSTLLKYLFYFTVVKLFYAYLLYITDCLLPLYKENNLLHDPPPWIKKVRTMFFVRGFFMAQKLLVGFGMDYFTVTNNFQRIIIIVASLSGAVLIFGISVTWLSLVIALYMRRGEVFRIRFRLMAEEMEETNIPHTFRDKVLKFYRMYWHKQKAVSSSELLKIFPPSLNSAITTDIYFEALQKSRILRDLSYQFMSEIAKVMQTIKYVPGDIMIKRDTFKSTMYFITYGDVEMLTAEDDETPLLRFTRGTIINPCGGCMDVAGARAHVAVRAATFCVAHVLHTRDLWRVAAKFGQLNSQSFIIRSSFEEHIDRVKKHYKTRTKIDVRYKTSILLLKRNLIDLKAARDMRGKLILGRDDKFIEIASCYLMRNRGDTKLDDEFDAICLRPTFPCILQPTSSLLMAWEIAVSIINFFIVLVYPYRMLYYKTISIEFRFFDVMVTVVYILDIIAHLSTGDNIEEGVPITFTQTSADQVKSSMFFFDVISTVPFFTFLSGGHFSGINKVLKAPKIFLLLWKVDNLWLQQTYVVRLVMFIFFMFLAVYLIVLMSQLIICHDSGLCAGVNLHNASLYAEGPLGDDPEVAFIQLYFQCFTNLSIFTLVHVPKIKTIFVTFVSQCAIFIFIEFSVILRIVINAVISASVMVAGTFRDAFENIKTTVNEFFAKNNVAPILKYRFLSYISIDWYIDKAFSVTYGKNIFFDLPSHVLQDMLTLQRIKFLLRIPITKYASRQERKVISSKAKMFFSPPNEILLNTGDLSTEVYVIKSGHCDVIDPETKKVVRVLGVNGRFGELECLFKIPAYYTIKATTHVQVYAISRTDLDKVLSIPKINLTMKAIRQEAIFKHVAKKRYSFLKYEMPAPPSSVERFPLLRKHEPDTAFLAPFQRLGFFSVLRYVFPRYTIRPDGRYLKRYELLRMCCALVSACLFPIYNWLVLEWPVIYYITILLDCTAYFDIFQRMLIAYFNEKGILVYHPASTAGNYVKGTLLLDLAACFPLESLDSMRDNIYFSVEKGAYRITVLSQVLRYNRIIQLYRVPKTMEIWFKDYIGRKDIMLILKATPFWLCLINMMTSIIMEFSATIYRPQEVESGGKWIFVQKNVDEKHFANWMDKDSGIDVWYRLDTSPRVFVLSTFYWVVNAVTTTGFQLALPSSVEQTVIFTWGIFIAFLVMTSLAVRVISFRANINRSLATFKEHMKELIFYMKRENIRKDIQKQATAYYRYSWEKTGGIDYCQIIEICTHISLKTDFIDHIYGTTFRRCPLLLQSEVSFLRSLGEMVHSKYYPEGMTVIEMNDIIRNLYFIDFGSVNLYTHDDVLITKLTRGSVFGNFKSSRESLIRNKIVTFENTHLLKVTSIDFFRIIANFPKVQELIEKYRPNQENYIIGGSTGPSTKISFTWKFSSAVLTVTKKESLKFFNLQSKYFQLYLVAVSLTCVYMDIYNAAFEVNTYSIILALYILDFAFTVKPLLNFLVPYFAEDATETKQNLLRERKRYFAKEFKLDLLSCVPLEIFFFLEQYEHRWITFAALRLNRILRLITVHKCLKQYYQKRGYTSVTSFMTMLMWFITLMHVFACVWYKIAKSISRQHTSSGSWFRDRNETTCEYIYFCSFYYVLTTSILASVDDIKPRRRSEVIFVTALMIFASMFFLILIGEFTYLIHSRVFGLFEYYSLKLECDDYLRNNRVTPTLKTLVKKYIPYLWREQRGKQMPQFLLDAPHCLRLNIMSDAYIHHLENHELFQHCAKAFLRVLCGHFRLYTYMEGMLVVKEGEVTDCMYFIHKGTVMELSEDFEEDLREFQTGHHFGTAHGLAYGQAFTHSYKTVTKAQILSLNLSDWEHLLVHFPFSRETINKKLDKDKNYDVCKVKEKWQTMSSRSTRVLFESKDALPDLRKLDSDTKSISSKKQETVDDIKKEPDTKQETEDTESSWPMFSRFSIAPGRRESSLKRLSEKKQKPNIQVQQEKRTGKEKGDLSPTGEVQPALEVSQKESLLIDQPEAGSSKKLHQSNKEDKKIKLNYEFYHRTEDKEAVEVEIVARPKESDKESDSKTVKETSRRSLSISLLPPSDGSQPPKKFEKAVSPSGAASDKTSANTKTTEYELPITTTSSADEIELTTIQYDDEVTSKRKSSETPVEPEYEYASRRRRRRSIAQVMKDSLSKKRKSEVKQDEPETKTTESLDGPTKPTSSQVPEKKQPRPPAKQDQERDKNTKATKSIDSKIKSQSTLVSVDRQSQSLGKKDSKIGVPETKDKIQKSELQQDLKLEEKTKATTSFHGKTKPSLSIVSGHKRSHSVAGKLEFKDEVTTIDVPTKEEVKTTEDLTSGQRLSELNLSFMNEFDEKDVEDYLDNTDQLRSESKESLASLESSMSLTGVATSSIWSVENFMTAGKKKKGRVSIAEDLQSSVSLATLNMGSVSDIDVPSHWQAGAVNLDILDHRMLQTMASQSSLTSEVSENYLTE